MSITRAFTTRRVKQSLQAANGEFMPHRSNTTKGSVSSIRNKISGPVELIHTTNMLSYNAPDLHPQTASSIASSTRFDDDLSDSAPTTASTPPTSPDVPTNRSMSPEPNHLSCYFTAPGQALAPATKVEAPIIPKRAPSHTKKASYEALARSRSNSRLSEQSSRTVSTKASFSFSRSSSSSTNTSATSHTSALLPPQQMTKVATVPIIPASPPTSAPAPSPVQYSHRKEYSVTQHPFGQELAQVTEIAEDYGVKERLNVIDEEEHELAAQGLFKFSAEEYLGEIQGLFSNIFTDARPAAAMWI